MSTHLIFRCRRIIERFSANIAVEASLMEDGTTGGHFLGLVDGAAAPLARVLVPLVGLDPGCWAGVQWQRRVPDLGVTGLAVDLLVEADINLEKSQLVQCKVQAMVIQMAYNDFHFKSPYQGSFSNCVSSLNWPLNENSTPRQQRQQVWVPKYFTTIFYNTRLTCIL